MKKIMVVFSGIFAALSLIFSFDQNITPLVILSIICAFLGLIFYLEEILQELKKINQKNNTP